MSVYFKEKPWATMNRHFLDNPDLSPKAKGLLAYILSRPEGWDYSINGLAACNGAGEKAIRSGIKELEEAGYLRRIQVRDDSGEFGSCDWEAAGCPLDEITVCPKPARREAARRKGATSNRKNEVNGTSYLKDRERRRPRRVLPDDWSPHEKHYAKAQKLGVSCDHEADKFRSFHLSKDNRYADWDQAFYTWLRNAKEFKQPTQSRSTTPPLRRATWDD